MGNTLLNDRAKMEGSITGDGRRHDVMNKFSKYFDDSMSEYQISKVYFTLIDNLSPEEIQELEDAATPYWERAIDRDLDFVAKTGYMMGL